jgi:MYXO-CTERM domain-containing protein
VHGQQIGYHLREGVHDLTQFDWDLYMDFFRSVELPALEPGEGGAGGTDAAGGSAGTPNSAGTGGMPIAGGSGGSGNLSPTAGGGPMPAAGHATTDPQLATPAATDAGCGCRIRGARSSAPVGSWIALAFAAAASWRRRGFRKAHSVRADPTNRVA